MFIGITLGTTMRFAYHARRLPARLQSRDGARAARGRPAAENVGGHLSPCVRLSPLATAAGQSASSSVARLSSPLDRGEKA